MYAELQHAAGRQRSENDPVVFKKNNESVEQGCLTDYI